MGIIWTKTIQHVDIHGARIVLVKDAHLAIVHHQAGVTNRAIDGCHHRHNHETQPIDLNSLGIFCINEFSEANIPQCPLEQI